MNSEHNNVNPMSLSFNYTIKLSKDDIELLKERALKEGWSVSKLIRYCLFIEGVIYSCK